MDYYCFSYSSSFWWKELMRGLGKGVKSFKDGVNDAKDELNKAKDELDKTDSAK